MVRVAVVSVIGGAVWFGYLVYENRKTESEKAAAARITESHILYIDDIDQEKTGPSADEFESAFALDSACRGLRLIRWSRLDQSREQPVLVSPHWDLYVWQRDNPHPGLPSDFSDLSYGVRMTPFFFSGVEVGFGPVSAMKDAVHSVCFVASGKGGQ